MSEKSFRTAHRAAGYFTRIPVAVAHYGALIRAKYPTNCDQKKRCQRISASCLLGTASDSEACTFGIEKSMYSGRGKIFREEHDSNLL
ncbi:MAG: DUF6783 domain-containing protein [Blautia wexlerae]